MRELRLPPLVPGGVDVLVNQLTPNSMPMRRTVPSSSQRPRPPGQPPTSPGWSDDIAIPPSPEHLLLDTGIWYSIANSFQHAGVALAVVVKGHERNQTIANEVAYEPTRHRSAIPAYQTVVALMERDSKQPCRQAADPNKVQAIQRQLIADSQRRSGVASTTRAARRAHAGEAELITCAAEHDPKAVMATNDAGASSVAARHSVSSVHFGHVVRAAVRAGALTSSDAVAAYGAGLAISGIPVSERQRTENASWLET